MNKHVQVLLAIEDEARLAFIRNRFESIGRHTESVQPNQIGAKCLDPVAQPVILASENVTLQSEQEIQQFKQLCEVHLIVVALCDDDEDLSVDFFRLGVVDVLMPDVSVACVQQTVCRIDECAQARRQRLNDRAQLEKTNDELQKSLRVLKQDQIAGLEVQKSLMPESPLRFGDYQISHSVVPSLYLSGDFVGYNVVLGRYLLFYFADVSGHGASSAFVTVLLRFMIGRLIRRHQLEEDYTALALAPQGLVEHINTQMLATGLGKHMTLVAGSVDMSTHRMRYVLGAQLPQPILVVDGVARYLQGAGKPVGIFADGSWKVEEVELPERSALILLSDGVFDLMPQRQIAEKETAILDCLAEHSGDLDDLKRVLSIDTVTEPQDDISVLLMTRGF